MISENVKSYMVVPEHYRQQVQLHSRLKEQAKREDKKSERRRLEWVLIPDTHIAIKLHHNTGKLPAGVVLSVPRAIALALITRRFAVPVGDLKVRPDAIIDCDWADIGLV